MLLEVVFEMPLSAELLRIDVLQILAILHDVEWC